MINPEGSSVDVDAPPTYPAPLALARTTGALAPLTLDDFAALKSEALDVIAARVQIIDTLRKAAIRATAPADWVLFKSPDGNEVGYLQDCGADRVRDLFGIEVYDVGTPEKIPTADPRVFHYVIHGSGRCKITGQIVERVEGGRSSTEDFCKGKAGVDLELAVRKAARANLDGGITRKLAGLKSVPIDDLLAAWVGMPKKIEALRHGRGYGTRDERLGARSDRSEPAVEAPVCRVCRSSLEHVVGARGGFYRCPNRLEHGNKAYTVDAKEWVSFLMSRAEPVAPEPPARVEPPPVDEVFK